MKERPILFSGPMVRAILEGRKTQTRRVIKPQAWRYSNDVSGQRQIYARSGPEDFGDPDKPIRCPYGQPGDLLWVRETWAKIWECEPPDIEDLKESPDSFPWHIEYKANSDEKYPGDWPEDEGDNPDCAKWQSSRFMFKKYARLWLRITNVRIERVREISIEDCKAEGVLCDCLENEDNRCLLGNKGHFKILWDSLNAKRGYPWESNPWVWVVEFERYERS